MSRATARCITLQIHSWNTQLTGSQVTEQLGHRSTNDGSLNHSTDTQLEHTINWVRGHGTTRSHVNEQSDGTLDHSTDTQLEHTSNWVTGHGTTRSQVN